MQDTQPMTLRAKLLFGSLGTIAVTSAVVFSCGGPVKRPDGGMGLLPVGAPAPEVAGEDAEGNVHHLSEVRGSPAVVYFYPKDETPGCTAEACAFRDAWKRFEAAHVTIFAVSRDTEESHKAFAKEHELPFSLVADPSGEVSERYGVPSIAGMTRRVTFLVGKDGKIAKVWPEVDPGVHADQVLAEATR